MLCVSVPERKDVVESFIDSWIRGPHKREVDSVEAEFAG